MNFRNAYHILTNIKSSYQHWLYFLKKKIFWNKPAKRRYLTKTHTCPFNFVLCFRFFLVFIFVKAKWQFWSFLSFFFLFVLSLALFFPGGTRIFWKPNIDYNPLSETSIFLFNWFYLTVSHKKAWNTNHFLNVPDIVTFVPFEPFEDTNLFLHLLKTSENVWFSN